MAQINQAKQLGAKGYLFHLVAYAVLWIVLSGGDFRSWVVGGPAVIIALWATVKLAPVEIPRFNPLYLLVFIPIFFKLSFGGGIDVASRAMSRKVRLAPALIDYDLRLVPGTPRYFFLLLISLLPGTLSADLDGDRLVVHVLDREMDNHGALLSLETQVARLFAEPLGPVVEVS